MGPQRLIGRFTIARGYCGNDLVVFGQRNLVPAFRGERGIGHQRHRPMHQVKLLDQKPVVAGQVDLLVKALVRPAKRTGVAAQQGAVFGSLCNW